jgi:hypothetical protein
MELLSHLSLKFFQCRDAPTGAFGSVWRRLPQYVPAYLPLKNSALITSARTAITKWVPMHPGKFF